MAACTLPTMAARDPGPLLLIGAAAARHANWPAGPSAAQAWGYLLLAGSCRCQAAAQDLRLVRGQLCWAPPGLAHRFSEPTDDLRLWLLCYDETDRASLGEVGTLVPTNMDDWNRVGLWCRGLTEAGLCYLDDLFGRVADCADGAEVHRLGRRWALAQAWRTWWAGSTVLSGGQRHPAIEQALALLHAGTAPTTLTALAKRCGLGHDHFGRLFHAQVGVGVVAYRNRLRVDRVLAKLQERDMPLLEAALACGFGSYAQFHRVFTGTYGITPSVWLRTWQEVNGTKRKKSGIRTEA